MPALPFQPWSRRRLIISLLVMVTWIGVMNVGLMWMLPLNLYLTTPVGLALPCVCFMREPDPPGWMRFVANAGVAVSATALIILPIALCWAMRP